MSSAPQASKSAMPTEQTLQGFLDNGTLLIQARPTTTRLTLKYNIPKATEGTVNATNTNATLVAKAYDPVGGVCLKYETNRAAEVGRLILGFQELGQVMSNIPPTKRKESPVEDETRGEPMAVDEPAKVKAETKMDVVTETKSSGTKKKKKAKR